MAFHKVLLLLAAATLSCHWATAAADEEPQVEARQDLSEQYRLINEQLSRSSVRVNMDTVNNLLAEAEEAGDTDSDYARALKLISALDQITLMEVCQQPSRQLIRENNQNVLPQGVWWETSGKRANQLSQIEKLVKHYYDWFNKTCPGAESIHNDPEILEKKTFAQRMRAMIGRRGYY